MTSPAHRLTTLFTLILTALLITPPARADVRLPAVIADHMVLQQQTDAPLWGWADTNEAVTIRASWLDTPVVTKADAHGDWSLTLTTPAASNIPHTITFIADNTITLTDILIGEVWICSGQSNMEWPLTRTDNSEQEIADADHPRIRLFNVQRTVALEPQTDCIGAWSVCSPDAIKSFSAVGYFFGRALQSELDIPIGLIGTNWGGTRVEPWTSAQTLNTLPDMREWVARVQSAKDDPELAKKIHQNDPTTLYNGMIAPLQPFAIRGAIWYQGESNRNQAHHYRTRFPAMITDWRANWNCGDFPFYYVQIAPFTYGNDTGQTAELREAQLMTLATPNTGMVVTTDIGNIKDIHPTNKQEVGRRLSLWALSKTYGQSDLVCSGPLYQSMTIEDDRIRLTFNHVADGLVCEGESLTHFTIAGEDQIFHPASAIIDGDTILVSADEVPSPVAVRFGWSDTCEPNLFNSEHLPASPFRTDTWPGVTTPK
jgi:sialate O-acetylesterase